MKTFFSGKLFKRVLAGVFLSLLLFLLYAARPAPDCSGDEFDLQLIKVYPKIVTPSYGRQDNNWVFFEFYDPQYESASLKIFSLEGISVQEIDASQRYAKPGTLDWFLKWDCRNYQGVFVNPGVYIYQFESRSKNYTGTIVVAR